MPDPFRDNAFSVYPRRRKPTIEDLMGEQEKVSMLRGLAQQGVSGLSGLAWLLDTPRAMLAGGLTEGPGKAISALWEGADERVSGRDMLRKMGLIGSEDNWGNFSTGLLTEILTDPLSWASLGLVGAAKTSAREVARQAGMLTGDLSLLAQRGIERGAVPAARGAGRNWFYRQATPQTLLDMAETPQARGLYESRFRELAGSRADELLRTPLERTNRIGVPGFQRGAVDLYGKTVGDALALGRDRFGAAARATPILGPTIRGAQALFNPRVMGFTDEAGQRLGRELTEADRISGVRGNTRLSRAYVDAARNLQMSGLGDDFFTSQTFADAFGKAMEGQWDQLTPELAQLFRAGGPAADLLRTAKRSVQQAKASADRFGIPLRTGALPNDIQYLFRQAVKFDSPRMAPGFAAPADLPYDPAMSIAGITSGEARRRSYLEAMPRWLIDKMAQDKGLQDTLRQLPNNPTATSLEQTVNAWLRDPANKIPSRFQDPFDYVRQSFDLSTPEGLAAAQGAVGSRYQDLSDFLRRLPLQHAEQQIPFFGNSLNDFATMVRSRSRDQATAKVLLENLAKRATPTAADQVLGGTALSAADALKALHFADDTGLAALARQMGVPAADLGGYSIPKEFVDQLGTKIKQARVPVEAKGLLKLFDNYTQRFKTLALAWPARYFRDVYSGSFAGATQGAYNPLDALQGFQVGQGNYAGLPGRLKGVPRYDRVRNSATPAQLNRLRQLPGMKGATDDQLLDELVIRQALKDMGGQGLTSYTVADELGRAAENLGMREVFPGAGGKYFKGVTTGRPLTSLQSWNPFALRTRQGNPSIPLEIADRASMASDNINRIGTYLTRIGRGDAPEAAKAIADLTQVNYRPEAFTAFEREVMKRIVPFYSYTKGISPLVFQELTERPAGLMGQSIRAIARGSEPREDSFVPEYMRQSAAIPLPAESLFGVKTPGVQRFLTNIDLPHEGLLNLVTPGTGNTLLQRLMDSATKTSQNILGQSNPVIKGPLEYATNRQFYSGRQLSDLYSMLEHDIGELGRPLEQILVNAPGGSRALGILRHARDERISPRERAQKFLFNAITGLKFQDVDQERTVRLAARTQLNDLLDRSRGMSKFENLYISPENLAQLPPTEQRQYLLYRVLQAEAARQARGRTRDPLAAMGLYR